MTAPTRRRTLRWAAPVAATVVVGVATSGVLTAEADPPLPPKTAAQLLVDVQGARVDGLSGTVVQDSDLGLPALPSSGPGADSTSPLALLTGSHTLRVWYAGQSKQRLALLGRLGETDVVRNGRDAWLWSSGSNAATHYRLPADGQTGRAAPVPSPLTPQEAAEQALAAIDPTTSVSTDGTRTVAGRDAYELVLAPRDPRSLVGQVRLAVDAQTSIPLRVQLFGRASADGPAFSVGFTKISFEVPGDDQFRFSPPPGATVTEGALPSRPTDHQPSRADLERAGSAVRTIGTGWTTVVVLRGVGAADRSGPGGAFVEQLPRVSGSWGSGRLLTSTLVSALITDDGRLVAGTVAPEQLYAAAAR